MASNGSGQMAVAASVQKQANTPQARADLVRALQRAVDLAKPVPEPIMTEKKELRAPVEPLRVWEGMEWPNGMGM